MKKIYILFISFFSLTFAYSQTALNVFNITGQGFTTTAVSDYQCLGINPANLGWSWDNHMINVGILETGLSIYTNALTKKQVNNDLFNSSLKLSMPQRVQAANNFTDTRLWGQGGITWLGLSVNVPKIGGFAISIRDRFLWNTVLNNQAARFLFMGYHDSTYFDSLVPTKDTGYATKKNRKPATTVYNGTKIQFVWYREYNFGFGRKIIENDDVTLYGGIGIKYLVGYGALQYIDNGSSIDAFSSLSPVFKVNYNEPTPNPLTGSSIKKVGQGWGFDIGFTLQLMKKLKIAVALNDIGSIKWDKNLYQAGNVTVLKISTPGISNYNIFTNSQLINTGTVPGEKTWSGLASKTVSLPMTFRGGASYQIIPQIEAGLDVLLPLNTKVPGSYDKGILGLGGKFDLVKWVELSIGMVTGADVGVSVPLGVTFYPVRNDATAWQIGFAIPDVMTLLKNRDIMTGITFGFVKLSFGKTTE